MGLGSDSLPVSIDLFDKRVYLADSMQFHLEYLLRFNKKGVYYIMPTFRGEDPDQTHLNEFYHSEVEIVGGLQDIIQLGTRYIKHLTQTILDSNKDSLKELGLATQHLHDLVNKPQEFLQITFKDAEKMVGDDPACFSSLPGGFKTLSKVGERSILQKLGVQAVWLTHLPNMVVPFYQAEQDENFSRCADLLMDGVGEILGSGERHLDISDLTVAMLKRHVNPDEYGWYLKLKSSFPLQTSGFGLGIERFIMWITGHRDIRDIALISRLKNYEYYP
jgi:aspartyl/asparaginyl-tRNA synthetase